MEVVVTLVYAKCNPDERLQLWESLYAISQDTLTSWLVVGDFNVITNEEEKLGGLLVTELEVRDFNHCINMYLLDDRGFKGRKYTWWNGRTDDECIFKRLDRILCNDKIQSAFPVIEVEHLMRSGSDHAPLLLTLGTTNENIIKSFRFLDFWLPEDSFMQVVRQHWKADFHANSFSMFHYKLKRLKKALTKWSKETFGNIFQEIATLKDVIKVAELQFETEPNAANREKLHEAQAKLNLYLHREEEFWKHKAGMQ